MKRLVNKYIIKHADYADKYEYVMRQIGTIVKNLSLPTDQIGFIEIDGRTYNLDDTFVWEDENSESPIFDLSNIGLENLSSFIDENYVDLSGAKIVDISDAYSPYYTFEFKGHTIVVNLMDPLDYEDLIFS